MITIGQLAGYAGVTIKAVRHYHQRGLLTEPPRDSSGYRRYGAQHAIDLVKIKTLAEAGVPLARINELLAADPDRFAAAIAEIDRDLAERATEIVRTRQRIAQLSGGDRLFVSAEVAGYLDRLHELGVSQRTVQMERDIWILLQSVAPNEAAIWIADKLDAMDEEEFRAIYLEYDAAFDWSPDDPRLSELADRTARWMASWYGSRPEGEPRPAQDPAIAELVAMSIDVSSPAWDRLTEIARQRRAARLGRLEAGLFEPGLVGGQEVPVSEVVEHAPGLLEPAGDVAGHQDPRGGGRGQVAGGPVPAGPEVLPQLHGRRPGQTLLLRRRQAGGAQQPAGIKRAEGTSGRVVGKYPGQEQRHVAEPAVHAGSFGLRNRVKQPGQPYRVQFTEPPGPHPPADPDPVPATGHSGKGGQKLGQEQPPGRVIEEVPQCGGIEDRHPLAQPGALGHVTHRGHLDDGLLDQHGEHQEGRCRNRPSAGRLLRAEHGAEHPGMIQQPQQRIRIATQPRGIHRVAAHLTGARRRAGRRGQQAQVSIAQMACVLTASHQTVHYPTLCRRRPRRLPAGKLGNQARPIRTSASAWSASIGIASR